MANVLHIQASPRGGESFSTRAGRAFLAAYCRTHPADRVETLDLFNAEVPDFRAPEASAKYAILRGQVPADDVQAAWAAVIKVINHFKGFDKYVLSCPMWNFGIPYRLKQYLDVIVQPGLTFSFSTAEGYKGLVTGRPMMLILARGGAYDAGNPMETYDFQEPYLRTALGFIGFTDIRAIRVQPTLAEGPKAAEEALRQGIPEAEKAASNF